MIEAVLSEEQAWTLRALTAENEVALFKRLMQIADADQKAAAASAAKNAFIDRLCAMFGLDPTLPFDIDYDTRKLTQKEHE